MNHHQLNYFMEVYNRRSIKKAAENLLISSQGLSKVIKSLENELGAPLFIRKNGQMMPTETADALLPHARRITEEFSLIENGNTFHKKLRVCSANSFFQSISEDFLGSFYRECPDITLKIMETTHYQAIERLKNDDCELAILPFPYNAPGYKNEFLISYRYGLLLNRQNPLAEKKTIEPADFHKLRLAGHGDDYESFSHVIALLNHQNYYPDIVLETNNELLSVSMARNNLAAAAVAETIACKYVGPELVFKPLWEETDDLMHITYKTSAPLGAEARTFMKLLLHYIKELRD